MTALATHLSECVACGKIFVAHEGHDLGLMSDNVTPWKKGHCSSCWRALQSKPAVAHPWSQDLEGEE